MVNLGLILVVELIVVVTLGERSNLLNYSVVVELVEPYSVVEENHVQRGLLWRTVQNSRFTVEKVNNRQNRGDLRPLAVDFYSGNRQF